MKKEYNFKKGKRGAVISPRGKTRITLYLDDDILEVFRKRADKAGMGYQTVINQVLREFVGKKKQPIDEAALRRILREELKKTG
jgi:uncharacterized protein (DUF4415 family)